MSASSVDLLREVLRVYTIFAFYAVFIVCIVLKFRVLRNKSLMS